MKIINNYDLSKSTTFHIGGIAKRLYIPESEKEALDLIGSELNLEDGMFIIGGGSNLLINDKKKFESVIDTRNVDKNIIRISDGKYYVGCSNRIQKVIKIINHEGYGGFEELISLPATFGGIICMNAGIGPKNKVLFTISDFIDEVKVINIKTKKIEWVKKESCNFSHRHSVFQNGQYLILGANIHVYKQSLEESEERIKKRIEKANKYERGKGCFGSCFAEANSRILKIVSIMSISKKGVHQSKNNCNWLVNDGSGTYNKTMKIINRCIFLHKVFHKNIKTEVKIWS